jgi:predicted transcriptional regulator
MKRPRRRTPELTWLADDEVSKTHSITRRQIALLRRLLLEDSRFGMTDLARELGFTRQALYHAIWVLEQRGFLRLQRVGPPKHQPYTASPGPVLSLLANLKKVQPLARRK